MAKWYEEAIFYHMYPLGLSGAPAENDGGEIVHRFRDLEKWLYHIKTIGSDAIYIGPLFESVTHGYDTTDYKLVDRRLGDNEDFIHFVNKCHDMGIKVVVDGVFNHSGREFFAFQDLLKNRENSKYKDWYCQVNFGGNNNYNDGLSYESWRGCTELVKYNLRNPEVKNYLFDVIQFWVDTFDIDGIRLDCADVLDFDFMREMRQLANGIKPDFWLMGEVIHGNYGDWVNEQTLHSVTDYELHKGLYSGHNDHNYFEIAHTIRRLFDENGGLCKDGILYTFVDNHDVNRIVDKLNDKRHLIPVHFLLYTLPGLPSIYYGSEFMVPGNKDHASDAVVRPELHLEDYIESIDEEKQKVSYKEGSYTELLQLISKLADIHKQNAAFSVGKYRELYLTNRQYAFARMLDDDVVITIVNNDENEATVNVPVPVAADKARDLFTDQEVQINNGCASITVKACAGTILKVSTNR